MRSLAGALNDFTSTNSYHNVMGRDGWLDKHARFVARVLFYAAAAASIAAIFLVPPAFFATSSLVCLALFTTCLAHRRDMNCFGQSLFSWMFSTSGVKALLGTLIAASGLSAAAGAASMAGLISIAFLPAAAIPIVMVASLIACAVFVVGYRYFGSSSYEVNPLPPKPRPPGGRLDVVDECGDLSLSPGSSPGSSPSSSPSPSRRSSLGSDS